MEYSGSVRSTDEAGLKASGAGWCMHLNKTPLLSTVAVVVSGRGDISACGHITAVREGPSITSRGDSSGGTFYTARH